ncbi:MAG: hypothetical protein EZS28_004879, partial [Streblomastix strix]
IIPSSAHCGCRTSFWSFQIMMLKLTQQTAETSDEIGSDQRILSSQTFIQIKFQKQQQEEIQTRLPLELRVKRLAFNAVFQRRRSVSCGTSTSHHFSNSDKNKQHSKFQCRRSVNSGVPYKHLNHHTINSNSFKFQCRRNVSSGTSTSHHISNSDRYKPYPEIQHYQCRCSDSVSIDRDFQSNISNKKLESTSTNYHTIKKNRHLRHQLGNSQSPTKLMMTLTIIFFDGNVRSRLVLFKDAWQEVNAPTDRMLLGISARWTVPVQKVASLLKNNPITPQSKGLRQSLQEGLKENIIKITNPKEMFHFNRVFTVPRKDGSLRRQIDCRKANNLTQLIHFKKDHLCRILESVYSGDWFISLDIYAAYSHIKADQSLQPFLAISVNNNVYTHTVMPFGLSRAPYIFTKIPYDCIYPLQDQQRIKIFAYTDDILKISKSYAEAESQVNRVANQLTKLDWIEQRIRQYLEQDGILDLEQLHHCQKIFFGGII